MRGLANELATRGLSLAPRLLLGTVALLFGAFMILAASSSASPIGFYLFGAVCLAVTLACYTWGRVRQFIGSLIGVGVFIAGVGFLIGELKGGVLWSGSRTQPSVFNAILFIIFMGLPGLMYALKTGFGFRKPGKQEEAEQDSNKN